MAAFTRVLAVLLLLTLTESARFEFVREGDEAVLPCESFRPEQSECRGTTWVFAPVSVNPAVELFNLGQIKVPDLSERVTLTEGCGLRIQHVRPQEAGGFDCDQYDRPEGRPISKSTVHLSVVSVTEEKDDQSQKLQCDVSSSQPGITVRWFFKARVVEKDHPELNIRRLKSGSVLIVKKHHFIYDQKHLIECEVMKDNQPQKNFSFTSAQDETDTNLQDDDSEDKGSDWLWTVLAVVLVVLVLLVLGLILWRKLKSKPGALKPAPGAVDLSPRAVDLSPRAVDLSPRAVDLSPRAVDLSPRAVDLSPRAVDLSPGAVDLSPGATGPAPQIEPEVEEEVSYASINHKSHRPEVRESEETVTYSSVRRTRASEDQL